MNRMRVLMVALCTAIFMCGFSVTAHAGGGDEYMEPTEQWEGLNPVEVPVVTAEPGQGWSSTL